MKLYKLHAMMHSQQLGKMWIHTLDVLLTRQKGNYLFPLSLSHLLSFGNAMSQWLVTKMLCWEQALAMKLGER